MDNLRKIKFKNFYLKNGNIIGFKTNPHFSFKKIKIIDKNMQEYAFNIGLFAIVFIRNNMISEDTYSYYFKDKKKEVQEYKDNILKKKNHVFIDNDNFFSKLILKELKYQSKKEFDINFINFIKLNWILLDEETINYIYEKYYTKNNDFKNKFGDE